MNMREKVAIELAMQAGYGSVDWSDDERREWLEKADAILALFAEVRATLMAVAEKNEDYEEEIERSRHRWRARAEQAEAERDKARQRALKHHAERDALREALRHSRWRIYYDHGASPLVAEIDAVLDDAARRYPMPEEK